LGNTGAGKSSLVKALTNGSDIDIGNGFSPCTKSAYVYPFPSKHPIVKFLDTRGLAETHYDPTEDITQATQKGHLLTLVAKTEEVEQSSVIQALKTIKLSKKIEHILIVYTAAKQVSNQDAQRLIQYKQRQFESVWGKELPYVAVDFECDDGSTYHSTELIDALSEKLPIVGLMIEEKDHQCAEEGNFDLIIIGTHGRTGLGHVLFGSTAEKVVRTAPCPVLTVRPKGKSVDLA
jgi:predicted GTPase